MSLIFATQLTAVATAALAVFAIATAWYEILAAADELVYESVPADVGCGLVIQARVRADGGEDIARTAPGRPAAAAVQEQRPLPAGTRPSAAGIDPVLEQEAKLRVDRHLADLGPLAVDDQDALAGRQPHVVDVQGDGIADAQPCVERAEGERAIADVGPLTYGAQPPDLRVGVKRPGCGPGEIVMGDISLAEPASRVEVVEGGQGVVAVADRTLGVSPAQQVPAVVADRPVPRTGEGKRVAPEPALAGVAVQPGQVLADPGDVRAAGVCRQRRRFQGGRVAAEDLAVFRGEKGGRRAAAAGCPVLGTRLRGLNHPILRVLGSHSRSLLPGSNHSRKSLTCGSSP
jgi:hypothetical protein